MERLSIETLIKIDTIERIEKNFIAFLSLDDQVLLNEYRDGKGCQNEVISRIGRQLESYLVDLFGIGKAYQELQADIANLDPIQYFYKTIAWPSIRRIRVDNPVKYPDKAMRISESFDDELRCIEELLSECDGSELAVWCQWVWKNKSEPYINWQIFAMPKKIDYGQLVNVNLVKPRVDYQWVGSSLNTVQVMHQVHYCIDCHLKDNDSCSTGFWVKKNNAYKISPLGRVLIGCPLNQKISQMHGLRKKNYLIAALATIMIDNPLCLVTGDRICNDCMLSCIYQKVDPVDTPSVESDSVRQILKLPHGAEIYLLLAKWNPLKQTGYQYNPKVKGRVAVVGMGPAGFAMSYYLLMAGSQIFGFDGLPIRESLEEVHKPIENFYTWADQLQPKVSGFGGVIDYGITVRWDKRLILLIWVLLRRFPQFSMMGSVRMGGAISIERLKEIGFDQVVMATGAGLPKAHPIQNKQGIYFANEFLMRLHLSGMMHHDVRMGLKLPIAIIGSGLTAIDAATEAQVYYIRFTMQVAFWADSVGLDKLVEGCSKDEVDIVSTWIRHGEYIRQHQKDSEKLSAYIQKEGGVHILYRRSMVESPAYRTHAMELEKALEQGIQYHEYMNPISVENQRGWVSFILCQNRKEQLKFKAQTVLIATGSKPNIAYYYENRNFLEIEEGYYKRENEFFAKSEVYPGYISIIGDLHPKYHGSVVGALASAKDSYLQILSQLKSDSLLLVEKVEKEIGIRITRVSKVSDGILAVVLDTQTELPIGSYIKIALMDEGVLIQIKGVIIEENFAWVDSKQDGAGLLLNQEPVGVLGPSGTRILSQRCTDRIHIVTDQSGVIWAAAIVSAAKQQNKQVVLYTLGTVDIPFEIEHCLIDQLVSNKSEDALYCLNAGNLKQIHQMGYQFRECFAICDGPMMCMLKGICGQCIQWQLDAEGEPLKAVFSCSWQSQPIVLIDIEHLSVRQKVDNIENTLYKKWKRLIRDYSHEE